MSFRPSQVRFIDEGGGQQDLESEQPKRSELGNHWQMAMKLIDDELQHFDGFAQMNVPGETARGRLRWRHRGRYQTLFHSHDQGVGVRGHLVSELKEQGLSQQRSGRGSAKSQRIAEKA